MAIVVRNTFLHIDQRGKDCDVPTSLCRSSSAPPSCRVESPPSDDASTVSTAIHSYTSMPPSCTTWHNSEEASSAGWETDTGSDCEACDIVSVPIEVRLPSHSKGSGIAPEMAQQQLDEMSETVTQIWSTLRSLESELATRDEPPCRAGGNERKANSAVTANKEDRKEKQKQTISLQSMMNSDRSSVPIRSQFSKLNSQSELFRPRSFGEIDSVLASVRQVLASTPDVAAAEVIPGLMGALTTISIKLLPASRTTMPGSRKSRQTCAAAIAQAALLEATNRSQHVYVLGYETKPFEDNPHGTGFSATLAVASAEWEATACWDTFQKGFCPRGSACRWHHPGREEIQPIRVTFC